MTEFSIILKDACFLEGSRWVDGRLWVSDCYTQRVISVAEDGSGPRVEAMIPGQPSGLGFLPDGRLLAVSMRDQHIKRRESDGSIVTHADLRGIANSQINDMAVDPQGRCWVGCFGFDIAAGEPMKPAVLVRVDPDGSAEVVAEDVWFPNGAVCDGRTLIVAETFMNRVTAFDVDADGSLLDRRDWARFGDQPDALKLDEVIPLLDMAADGMSEPDAEGAIWVADAFHGRALRVREGGEVLQEIDLPEGQIYDVTLGGADGRTLFLATSLNGPVEAERDDTRLATLFSTRVDVALG
ncbi:SMP-30/gluconolactonase/LRE family protein [Rhodococcus opacus]|jgi:sugar lactone lactonase YvrE|nr:SMP-30/gluconolactonase/LRE family protein [Rhodococcus sp. IEGM 248]WKN60650.1 SMP-30/gluconolactonase/LRE family protein [Rhodococcus opacus]